jgi:nitrite reductase (NADH) small subunit
MEENSVRICSVSELPGEGELREISVGQRILCMGRVEGRICAVDNECPHHGGPLGQGVLENGKVVCPWHAYAFDMTTGDCEGNRNLQARVFEVAVVGEDVMATL